MTAVEPPPVPVERIPHVGKPVRLPEVRKARASFIANIVTGAVLFLIGAAGMVAYFVMGLAS